MKQAKNLSDILADEQRNISMMASTVAANLGRRYVDEDDSCEVYEGLGFHVSRSSSVVQTDGLPRLDETILVRYDNLTMYERRGETTVLFVDSIFWQDALLGLYHHAVRKA